MIHYLHQTNTAGIVLDVREGRRPDITAWVDSSFGTHLNGAGQTGYVISLGGGPMKASSCKIEACDNLVWRMLIELAGTKAAPGLYGLGITSLSKASKWGQHEYSMTTRALSHWQRRGSPLRSDHGISI